MIATVLALVLLAGLLVIAALAGGGLEWIRRQRRIRAARRERLRIMRAATLQLQAMAVVLSGPFLEAMRRSVEAVQEFAEAFERVQDILADGRTDGRDETQGAGEADRT